MYSRQHWDSKLLFNRYIKVLSFKKRYFVNGRFCRNSNGTKTVEQISTIFKREILSVGTLLGVDFVIEIFVKATIRTCSSKTVDQIFNIFNQHNSISKGQKQHFVWIKSQRIRPFNSFQFMLHIISKGKQST